MELKKNPQADLEKKKSVFFQIGLVTALAVVLIAFEWATFDNTESTLGQLNIELEEQEMIPITQPKLDLPPPPPPQVTTIEIVEDEEEVEDIEMQSTEADQETAIEAIEEEEELVDENEIFSIVEDMPAFQGCEKIINKDERDICSNQMIMKYLAENTKYPSMASDNNISGKVYVTFLVDKQGNVTDVELLKGIGGGCDEEALKVVKGMPKWTPGKQRGKPARVRYRLPIYFTLRQ